MKTPMYKPLLNMPEMSFVDYMGCPFISEEVKEWCNSQIGMYQSNDILSLQLIVSIEKLVKLLEEKERKS